MNHLLRVKVATSSQIPPCTMVGVLHTRYGDNSQPLFDCKLKNKIKDMYKICSHIKCFECLDMVANPLDATICYACGSRLIKMTKGIESHLLRIKELKDNLGNYMTSLVNEEIARDNLKILDEEQKADLVLDVEVEAMKEEQRLQQYKDSKI